MKNLLLLIAILFTVSCSNNDDSEASSIPVTLHGRWYYDYFTMDGVRHEFTYENEGCYSDFRKGYTTYREDGEYVVSIFGECKWYIPTRAGYVFDGKTITYTKDGRSWTVDVIEMTESKLVLAPRKTDPEDLQIIDHYKR